MCRHGNTVVLEIAGKQVDVDACIEAFKPYWFRAVGLKHGRAAFEAAIAEERRRCNAFLVAAQRSARGRDGRR